MRVLKYTLGALFLASSLYASSTTSDCVCFKLEGEMGEELKALIEKYHGEIATMKIDDSSSSSQEDKGFSLFSVTEKKALTSAELSAIGQKLYESKCAVCHGDNGQKKAYGKSRALNTLSAEEMAKSIRGYKGGIYDRGMAFLMAPFASNVSEEEIKGVYEYLQGLK